MTPPKRGKKFHDPTKKWKKNSCPSKITQSHRLVVYDRSLTKTMYRQIASTLEYYQHILNLGTSFSLVILMSLLHGALLVTWP